MEQFEQPVLFIELLERGDRLVRKSAIGLGGQLAQAFGAEAVPHERLHDPRGQLRIRQAGHGRDLVRREPGPFARHIEPAIAGQPGQRRAFEIERRSAATGADIFHWPAR